MENFGHIILRRIWNKPVKPAVKLLLITHDGPETEGHQDLNILQATSAVELPYKSAIICLRVYIV